MPLSTPARLRSVLGRRGLFWLATCFASSLLLAVVEYGLVMFLQLFLVSAGYFARDQIPSILEPLSNLGTAELSALLVSLGALRAFALFLSAFGNDYTQDIAVERLKQATLYELLLRKGRQQLSASEVHFRIGELFPKCQAMISHGIALTISLVQVLALTGGMLFLAWRESAIALAGLGVAGVFVILSNRRVGTSAELVPPVQARFTKGIERVARNWLFVRVSRTERLELSRLLENVFRYTEVSRRVSFFNHVMMGIPPLFGVCLVAVLIYVSRSVFLTKASVLVSVLYLFLRLVQHLGNAALFFGQVTKHWPHFRQSVDTFTAISPSERAEALAFRPVDFRARLVPPPRETRTDRSDAPPPSLDLRNVSFAWERGQPRVVSGLDWAVPGGHAAGISGPSGSGKSTLLLLALGMLEPESGTITIDGLPPAAYYERNGYRVGYVGADPFLLEGTIADNLEYGLGTRPSEAELWAALESARLASAVRALPKGLAHPLDENGSGLSTGQKQRLSLARALLRDPRILVLDEATANLDVALEAEVAASIRALRQKCTVLIVSHREGLLAVADSVLKLPQG